MAPSPAFLDFACELLSGVGPVSARRMFGGAGLYADGMMFALVADDVIYLKADPALAEALEAEGCGPFVYDGGKSGKPHKMNYWRLPDAALDDAEIAESWARRALDVARAAKR